MFAELFALLMTKKGTNSAQSSCKGSHLGCPSTSTPQKGTSREAAPLTDWGKHSINKLYTKDFPHPPLWFTFHNFVTMSPKAQKYL